MPRGQVSAVHVVSAAEATWANLYCHFSRTHEGGEFLPALPQVEAEWPMHLQAMYIEILRGGVPVHGVPIGMYYVRSPGGVASMPYRIQGWTKRVQWQGDLWIGYGFGFLLRERALVAADTLIISAIYESARGER